MNLSVFIYKDTCMHECYWRLVPSNRLDQLLYLVKQWFVEKMHAHHLIRYSWTLNLHGYSSYILVYIEHIKCNRILDWTESSRLWRNSSKDAINDMMYDMSKRNYRLLSLNILFYIDFRIYMKNTKRMLPFLSDI